MQWNEIMENYKFAESNDCPTERDKSMDRHTIATTMAYLKGTDWAHLSCREDIFDAELLGKLDKMPCAQIVRDLCVLQNDFLRHNTEIYRQLTVEGKGLYSIPQVDFQALSRLESHGIYIAKNSGRYSKNQYLIDINNFLSQRINNCRSLFPDWVIWTYIRSFFIMVNGNKESGIKLAAAEFYKNRSKYPYQCWVSGDLSEVTGNIFASDELLVETIYKMNGDSLTDSHHSYVRDINEFTRGNIKKFMSDAKNIDVVVDCENSDPLRFLSAIHTINELAQYKLKKIFLINDPRASTIWSGIKDECPGMVVEEILLERIYENKSLSDVKLATITAKECYTQNVDSFLLVTRDSDFFGMLTTLTADAHFLVMLETEKCGLKIREKLREINTPYCFLDYFFKDQSIMDVLQKKVCKEVLGNLNNLVSGISINGLISEAVKKTRIAINPSELSELQKKLARRLEISVSPEDGKVTFELK